MSDLISREALIEKLEEHIEYADYDYYHEEPFINLSWEMVEDIVGTVPSAQQWIPCSERLPEEHDSIFKKYKGTDKWDNAMFESISGEVDVTVEYLDGTRKSETSHTVDGKWSCEKSYGINKKVIAWMPLPEPYKGE